MPGDQFEIRSGLGPEETPNFVTGVLWFLVLVSVLAAAWHSYQAIALVSSAERTSYLVASLSFSGFILLPSALALILFGRGRLRVARLLAVIAFLLVSVRSGYVLLQAGLDGAGSLARVLVVAALLWLTYSVIWRWPKQLSKPTP